MAHGREKDLEEKISELAALDETDVERALDALGRMEVALSARDADAMIGLTPVADELLDRAESAYIDVVIRLAASDPADAASAAKILGSVASLQLPEAAEGLSSMAAKFADEDPTGTVGYYAALFAFHGQGTKQDHRRAYELHEKAAAKGCPASMFELHVMTAQGLGCEASVEGATTWCLNAAEAGDARAMSNLGGFYATGQGLPVDLEKSVGWYDKAAQLGHGKAAATLGVMFASGQGVAVDADKAKQYFFLADDLGFDWYPMAEGAGLDPSTYG